VEELHMIDVKFHKARDVQDACALLAMYGGKGKILAGGTDLMARINQRLVVPEALICLSECGLDTLRAEGDVLVIGAMATYSAVMQCESVCEQAPLLCEAVKSIGSPAIRNMGTIGGNLANASPAGDAAVALLALSARVVLRSGQGERHVELDRFFVGPGKTVMRGDEVLAEVVVPFQPEGGKWTWRKLGQRKGECCSVASVAVKMRLDEGACRDVMICFGAVAPTPLISVKAAGMLEGRRLSEALLSDIAEAAAEEIQPMDDVRATAWYRRKATAGLIKSSLSQMMG
jgi:aerobic carbon-monoxide dehydrogenase medium subunit